MSITKQKSKKRPLLIKIITIAKETENNCFCTSEDSKSKREAIPVHTMRQMGGEGDGSAVPCINLGSRCR